MVTNSNTSDAKSLKIQNILVMVLMGLSLGLLGGLVQKQIISLIWAIILVGTWHAYDRVMTNNKAITKGLVIGAGLGTAVGLMGWLLESVLGGTIQSVGSGAIFGILRGIIIGGAVGIITRANSEEGDSEQTRFLIVGGSILLGIVLGGLVGLTAGFILGLIGQGLNGAIRATIAGSILGASIGSYFKEVKWIAVAAASLAILAAVSILLGGSVAGVIVGAISGSFAPILLVSGIGAFGGLTSRGLKAMVIEALEAPIEMMEQGAVPFLAPALIIGMIIGAMSYGAVGILSLMITFAFLGLFFGIINEITGSSSKITIRSMVETAMLGAETWPIRRVIQQLTHESKQAAIGAGVGAAIAFLSGVVGIQISQLLLNLITKL